MKRVKVMMRAEYVLNTDSVAFEAYKIHLITVVAWKSERVGQTAYALNRTSALDAGNADEGVA